MVRVMLVDDHVLLRQGTRALLQAAPDVETVAEAGDGQQALAVARRLRPDVMLLNIRLSGMSGIEGARTLRHSLPQTKVLMLTAYTHEAHVRALLAIGVHG
jgi:DNA-binding NarL/FixJ family response regulator